MVDTIHMPSVTISQTGQITIPRRTVNAAGVPERALLSVTIDFEDGEETFSAPLTANNRVTVPKRLRDEYGIEGGDTLDVEVAV